MPTYIQYHVFFGTPNMYKPEKDCAYILCTVSPMLVQDPLSLFNDDAVLILRSFGKALFLLLRQICFSMSSLLASLSFYLKFNS